MKPRRHLPDISPRDRIARVCDRVALACFVLFVLLIAAGQFD